MKIAESQTLTISPKFLIEGLTLLIIVIIAYNFSKSKIDNSALLALIGSFVYALQRLLPLTQQIYSAWATYKVKSASINDVLHELEGEQKLFNSVFKFQ